MNRICRGRQIPSLPIFIDHRLRSDVCEQVLKLCGPEPLTKYLVLAVVALQITCAYLLRDTSILSWKFLVTAYVIGATANQNLFLAIHEISHNLAFRSPMANRLLAILANLPIGIPYSAAFRVRVFRMLCRCCSSESQACGLLSGRLLIRCLSSHII
jgi:hypothetical protein